LRPVLPFTAPWFFSISRRSSPALIWLDQPGDPIAELHRQAHGETISTAPITAATSINTEMISNV